MWVVFAALHTVGWARFDSSVILGSLVGALVAIGNFAGICLVVQKIIDEQDEKRRKAKLQLSYNGRMLLQAVWVVVAIAAPCFQPFAGVLTSRWKMTLPPLRLRQQTPRTKGVKRNKWN